MSLGPELVVNGTFDGNLDGWVVDGDFTALITGPTSGAAIYTGTDTQQGRLTQTLSSVIPAGTTLRGSVDVSEYEGNNFPDGENYINFLDSDGIGIQTGIPLQLVFGSYSEDIVLVADCYKIQVYFENGHENMAAVIDNVSVREVLADAGGIMTDLPDDLWGW
jgi:hypothetical protein